MNVTTTKTVGSISAVSRALDILGLSKAEPRQPDEFTANEFAAEIGLSETQSRRRLREATEAGLFTRRRTVTDGNVSWLYRPVAVAKGRGKK